MALAVLAVGLSVSNKIHKADLRITSLTFALGREDRLEKLQRQLRQEIGRLTRDAERGTKVPDASWNDLHKRITESKNRWLQTGQSPDYRSQLGSEAAQDEQRASTVFVMVSDQLIETSRSNPSGIKAAMPRFLSARTAFETSRSQARQELTSAIWKAADKNRR
ncbi:hypothetical protein [Sphingomonas sp. Leaf38]|uniref:hypothetical protein n=1 Tax=Sphingomonas sp. Leaf38 TaxID=1736217 RepID=UPI0006FC1978|nr:hypothetical protein [Sphingomonas sp. Leaf38]KQN33054.1 hypothetical protein ASE88_03735 [Sphingomonas sp. Leaf38]